MIDLENRYQILETNVGPVISESRVTVFDVLEAQENGQGLYEISMNYNLTPLQVETAFKYIAIHRERLLPILQEILVKAAEREAYYRAKQDKIRAEIDALPSDPVRQRLNELRAKWNNGNHTD